MIVLRAIRDVLALWLACSVVVGALVGLAMIPPAPWVLIGVLMALVVAGMVALRIDTLKRQR